MERQNFRKDKVPFTQVANQVLNDKNLSAKAKGLYAYLYSKPEGWDFALDRICLDFKDGRKSVYSGIQELEGNGYLIREKQKTGRTIYLLKSQLTKIDIREGKPVAHNGNEPFWQSAKKGSISNKDIKVIKSISNKENILFEEFWKEYPVKKEKKKAKEKFERLSVEIQQVIIKDISKRRQLDVQWKAGYIPHPTTYLNGERWDDEIQTQRAGGRKLTVI